MNNPSPFSGSERELLAMTADLDEMNNDIAVPAMRDGVAAMIEGLHERSASRRSFLTGAGALAATLVGAGALPGVAGAATRVASATSHAREPLAFPPKGLSGDLAVAAVAASLENLAVFAYSAGLSAASAGKLGSVPAAVATFATSARAQHRQHAAAWNGVLRAHGKAAVTVTNPTLTKVVEADFAKVKTVVDLANLALTLETIAAETYQVEVSHLSSAAAIGLSASIQPVEMQHIAILYYVLGEYPGAQSAGGQPLAFSSTAKAV